MERRLIEHNFDAYSIKDPLSVVKGGVYLAKDRKCYKEIKTTQFRKRDGQLFIVLSPYDNSGTLEIPFESADIKYRTSADFISASDKEFYIQFHKDYSLVVDGDFYRVLRLLNIWYRFKLIVGEVSYPEKSSSNLNDKIRDYYCIPYYKGRDGDTILARISESNSFITYRLDDGNVYDISIITLSDEKEIDALLAESNKLIVLNRRSLQLSVMSEMLKVNEFQMYSNKSLLEDAEYLAMRAQTMFTWKNPPKLGKEAKVTLKQKNNSYYLKAEDKCGFGGNLKILKVEVSSEKLVMVTDIFDEVVIHNNDINYDNLVFLMYYLDHCLNGKFSSSVKELIDLLPESTLKEFKHYNELLKFLKERTGI